MLIRPSVFCSVTMAVLMPLGAAAQKPSARDTFWSASDLISVTPNPAAARPKPAAQNIPAKSHPSSPRTPNAQLVSQNGYGAAPQLVRTAQHQLGLRYSLLMRDSDGKYSEAAPGTTFHSGDHIRISLLANQPGYLYVIEQGSSGEWKAIFPPVTNGAGTMKLEQGKLQIVPTGNRSFAFDQQPGTEKLFIILSRVPLSDLMREIQHLKESNQAPAVGDTETLQAEVHIPDLFVQQLASRDLSLVDEQSVDDAPTASGGGEKAVYVVSKAQGNAQPSELVTSIQLRHE